jgi:hypothetical protein
MQVKTVTVLLLAGLLLLVALLWGAGLFSVLGDTPPTCVFSSSNNTCVYEYVLGSERAASIVSFDFYYDSVAGDTLLGGDVVLPLVHKSSRLVGESSKDYGYAWMYLYAMPGSWVDVHSVLLSVDVTSTVICDSIEESGRHYFDLRSVTTAYPYSAVRIASSYDNYKDNPLRYLGFQDRTSSGYDYYRWRNTAILGQSLHRCYLSTSKWDDGLRVDGGTIDYRLEGVIPSNQLFGVDTRFALTVAERYDSKSPGFSHSPPVVRASYYRAYFPSDVAYKIGGLPVETYSGVQHDMTSTLDLATQINLYCNRGVSVAECVVPITITSSTPGRLWVVKNTETLSFATEDSALEQLRGDIALLEGSLADKIAYINALDASIEEKALIIAELSSIHEEQLVLIDSLELSIEEQSRLINALTTNLEFKSFLVAGLYAETEEQAALIAAMEVSFANQGAIIAGLNQTVAEDKALISALSDELVVQAAIIAGMNQGVERESELVASLRVTIDEQEELIRLIQAEKRGFSSLLFFVGFALFLAGVLLWWFRRR